MVSLPRIQAAPAYDDALARDTRPSDTIPAPPPSGLREEDPPQSRIDSSRRRDTLPAPPPDDVETDEPPPTTERTISSAS